jgi:hypothetical protein
MLMRARSSILAAVAVSFTATAALAVSTVPYAELVDGASGRVVWAALVGDRDEVRLSFNHSLFGVEQTEVYVFRNAGIRLREVRFGSYDAADYYDSDPNPPAISDGDEWLIEASAERLVPPSPFRVGYETKHRVAVGDTRIEVADFIPSGDLAVLRGGRRSAAATLLTIGAAWISR